MCHKPSFLRRRRKSRRSGGCGECAATRESRAHRHDADAAASATLAAAGTRTHATAAGTRTRTRTAAGTAAATPGTRSCSDATCALADGAGTARIGQPGIHVAQLR